MNGQFILIIILFMYIDSVKNITIHCTIDMPRVQSLLITDT